MDSSWKTFFIVVKKCESHDELKMEKVKRTPRNFQILSLISKNSVKYAHF